MVVAGRGEAGGHCSAVVLSRCGVVECVSVPAFEIPYQLRLAAIDRALLEAGLAFQLLEVSERIAVLAFQVLQLLQFNQLFFVDNLLVIFFVEFKEPLALGVAQPSVVLASNLGVLLLCSHFVKLTFHGIDVRLDLVAVFGLPSDGVASGFQLSSTLLDLTFQR